MNFEIQEDKVLYLQSIVSKSVRVQSFLLYKYALKFSLSYQQIIYQKILTSGTLKIIEKKMFDYKYFNFKIKTILKAT